MPTAIARTTSVPGSRLDSIANSTYLREGQRGPAVLELQQLLNAHGVGTAEDGIFGRDTARAVRSFQQQHGLGVDGVVGPKTLAALRNAPAPRDTFNTPRTNGPNLTVVNGDRADFDMYAAMVRRAGGEVCPNGMPTVLGLRSQRGASRQYDDQFIVLRPDGTVQRFRGATHPGQSSSSASPDVNRDGRGDVGIIRPGNYVAVPNGYYKGAPSFHVKQQNGSGRLPGWRDTNHDGTYSAQERAASESRGDGLTEVLFHQGGDSAPSSIGCQTLSPAEFRRFLQAVGGSAGRFTYTLVEV